MGVSCLQGPHQSAQRSTTTGTCLDRSTTSVAKVASVTSMGMHALLGLGRPNLPAAVPSPTGPPGPPSGRSDVSESIKGIDVSGVTDWFEANVDGARGPLTFELIAGGHSN